MLLPTINWTPIFVFRERFERRTDRDFTAAINDNRSIWSSRVNVGTGFRTGKYIGQVVYNYNQDEIGTSLGTTRETRSDLQLGYVTFSDRTGDWTLGRQQIKKGSERLIGEGAWNGVSIAWDGVRFRRGGVDVWAANLGAANRGSSSTRMAGASLVSRAGETTYFFRHSENLHETVDAHTIDHLFVTVRGRSVASVEGAIQGGTRQGKALEAWATAARYTYKTTLQLSVSLEGTVASGGSNGDRSFTFDNSLASNHPIYGTMDMQSWKNSQVLSLLANYKPRPDVSIDLGYHRFGLRDASDSWYGAGGSPNGGFTDPTGAKGREVGDEFDLQAGFNVTPKFNLAVGASAFRPGRFIRAFRGVNAKDQHWFFVQATYRY